MEASHGLAWDLGKQVGPGLARGNVTEEINEVRYKLVFGDILYNEKDGYLYLIVDHGINTRK